MLLLTLRYTLADIDDAVHRFWNELAGYRVFAFSGAMGAGKTTFISHLGRYLHVQDTVSSPTFALINEYRFPIPDGQATIFHMDWYRLKNAADAMNAGMEDCLLRAAAGGAYCFVEWPEVARELLATPYLWITIETVSINERLMTVTAVA